MSRVAAIMWLRRRLLMNRLRRGDGVWSLVGTILLGVLWAIVAVAVAVGMGILMHGALQDGQEPLLFKLQLGLFVVALLVGVVLPLLAERGSDVAVTGRLLAFPVTPRELFWMSLAALSASAEHLFYYPALLAIGWIVAVGAGPAGLGLVILVSIWLCILAWAHVVALGVEALLRGRRSREIVGVVTILLILTLSLSPHVMEGYLDGRTLEQVPRLQDAANGLLAAGRTLAPYQAAAGLQAVRSANLPLGLKHLLGIWIWTLPGVLLARWVFVTFYPGDRGRLGAAKRSRTLRPTGRGAAVPLELRLSPLLPPVVLANAAKDLRTALRSMSGRLALILSPLILGFIGWSRIDDLNEAVLGLEVPEILFFGMLTYLSVFAHFPSINNLAYEGAGVQGYFLMPVSLKQVILGKNLGLWLFHVLLLVIGLIVLAAVGTRPPPGLFISGVLLYGAIIVFRTLVGNLMSFLFPTPRPLSSRKHRVSAMGNLIAWAAFLLFVPLAWILATLPLLLGHPQWQPVGLGLLLLITVVAYRISLQPAALLLVDRRERIIEIMRGAD